MKRHIIKLCVPQADLVCQKIVIANTRDPKESNCLRTFCSGCRSFDDHRDIKKNEKSHALWKATCGVAHHTLRILPQTRPRRGSHLNPLGTTTGSTRVCTTSVCGAEESRNCAVRRSTHAWSCMCAYSDSSHQVFFQSLTFSEVQKMSQLFLLTIPKVKYNTLHLPVEVAQKNHLVTGFE